MTLSSLVTALVVGVVLGLCARWLLPAGRGVPLWVALAVSVGAAMLGTVIGRLTGIDATGVSPVEVVLQVVFAGASVTVMAAAAGRQPPDRRYDVRGSR